MKGRAALNTWISELERDWLKARALQQQRSATDIVRELIRREMRIVDDEARIARGEADRERARRLAGR